MFQNLINHSVRSFRKQRAYVIINILGLSIGITCSLFIAFYVMNEVSYDRYNKKKARIFRLIQDVSIQGEEYFAAYTPSVLGPTIRNEIPEVEDFLRMTWSEPVVVMYNNQSFIEKNLVEADSSFFNFFSIPVIKGDSKNLLNAPHKLVLSESTAKKIFGDEDPIDKPITLGSDSILYTVSGVFGDIPENSHFNADIISSFMTNPRSAEQIWTNNSFSTYILVRKNSSYEVLNKKISELISKYIGSALQKEMGISMNDWVARGNRYAYDLQNLTDIHLDPSIQQEFKPAGDPKYLKIVGSLALLIVVIAAINFMNLSTAQASGRAKEVGIKKVVGSSRWTLILQFLTESIILSSVALILALVIIRVTLPSFNNLLETNLGLNLFTNWYIIPFLTAYTLLVGLLSGSYPAFVLSSFNPYKVLKGNVRNSFQRGLLRRVLVIFQFSVSIFLIVSTIIMYRQIKYMLNKDLGFNREQIIVISNAENLKTKLKSFKESVRRIPGVLNIVSSSAVPGHNNNTIRYKRAGGKDETLIIETNYIDYDFLETYGITLLSGRKLDESFSADRQACLINESAVKDFGITDLEKTRFLRTRDPDKNEYYQVIGVVKDFHFKSLHSQISPYMFCLNDGNFPERYLSVKLSPRNYKETISAIGNIWKEFTGNSPLEYYFFDDDIEQMYKHEKQNARIAVVFSLLAIFIAALGLFGLTSFTVDQRTREIGIRKAMGSSVGSIYLVISRETIILISISALIAWPIIYYIAGKWLENFYYRINRDAFSFIAGISIALGIAVLSISYRIFRAARINPAQSLKYE